MKVGVALTFAVSVLTSFLVAPIAFAATGAPTLPAVAAPAAAAAIAAQPDLTTLNQQARAEIVARLKKVQANLAAERTHPAVVTYAQDYPTAPGNRLVKTHFFHGAAALQNAWATKFQSSLRASAQGNLDAQQTWTISGPNLEIQDQKLGIALKFDLMKHRDGVDNNIGAGTALMGQIRALRVGDSLDHLITAVNNGQLDQQIGPLSSESQQILAAQRAAAVAAEAAREAAAKSNPKPAVNTAAVTATKPVPAQAPSQAPPQAQAATVPQADQQTVVKAGSL